MQPSLKIIASSDPNDYEIVGSPHWPLPPSPKRPPPGGKPLAYLIVRACWIFHKNDPDPWPSMLHGHHNEQPLKLDALNGFIYDIQSRGHVQTLKRKVLLPIQRQLLRSKDFGDRARTLMGAI
jgi:hypothetical protein